MPALDPGLRKDLERATVAARLAAEEGARAALDVLGVRAADAPAGTPQERRDLRAALRARAKVLGAGDRGRGVPLLVEEVAYGAWHRPLFARFLAENGLLRHPGYGVPVSLDECAELAREEGAADAWELAARYAARMLPGLFREDDPAARVPLAREHRAKLETLVAGLDGAVFRSDDGLGWVYQFWQSRKKDEVNRSGRKVGGADLAPVTQLFTEDYMVRFLLENSLGAWWAARHPDSPLVKEWDYLRFGKDGAPAAGSFPGWPERAAEVTVMDPCCGSGHFLVRAFAMLRAMREEEEGLSPGEAADAVLRGNLFGLELDPRCAQIAAFAVALEAWKVGGHPEANPPQVACSGVPVGGQLEEWLALAGGDGKLRGALAELHALFQDAPTLGSLIDPKRVLANIPPLLRPDWKRVEAALEVLPTPETERVVLALVAEDAARAARFLGTTYTLVATNVPYLKRGNQDAGLGSYATLLHDDAKADLATMMLDRCLAFNNPGGATVIVSPQNWQFLGNYARFRRRMLTQFSWNFVVRLGVNAFETISGEVVNAALLSLSRLAPDNDTKFLSIDATPGTEPVAKAALIRCEPILIRNQILQLDNPDARIVASERSSLPLLAVFANGIHGLTTGDTARIRRAFWELSQLGIGWSRFQSTTVETKEFSGRESLLLWNDGKAPIAELDGARLDGREAWRKKGVAVSQMGKLSVTLYTGEIFDNNTAVVLPKESDQLPAIWAYCSSDEFNSDVRKIDSGIKVTNRTLVKVPFDLERWQQVAAERYPDGLPEPHSDDPTQWLFGGHPKGADDPLQVAVARLLGYRWPEQPDADGLDGHADADGIACLPAVRGERPAAERLLALLADAWGADWSPAVLEQLLAGAGFGGKDLSAWLLDAKGFFHQHCRLFHNRPFVWHVWDGARDGFSALVNYHRLTPQTLDKLVHTYLGDWIATQRSAAEAGRAGAEVRLTKALELRAKLEAIQRGEPPFDVYVRWKPLHRQPVGWEPDLDDGVRLNVRPLVTAGVLRAKFSVGWKKDRGDNPPGSDAQRFAAEAQRAAERFARDNPALGLPLPSSTDGRERLNDLHLPRSVKEAARAAATDKGPEQARDD